MSHHTGHVRTVTGRAKKLNMGFKKPIFVRHVSLRTKQTDERSRIGHRSELVVRRTRVYIIRILSTRNPSKSLFSIF